MKKSTDNSKSLRLSVMREARQGKLPERIEKNDSRLNVCAHLIDEELLDGWVTLSEDGEPLNILDAYITPLGKEVMERFEEKGARRTKLARRTHEVSPSFPAPHLLKAAVAFSLLTLFLAFAGRSTEETAHAKAEPIHATDEPQRFFSTESVGVCGPEPAE